MNFKIPKNTDKIIWTKHVARKMRYYRLSESRVRGAIKNPKRKEEGVAPATIAVMQSAFAESSTSAFRASAFTLRVSADKSADKPVFAESFGWAKPSFAQGFRKAKPAGSKKKPGEIWVMYQIIKSKIKNQKSKFKNFIPSEAESQKSKVFDFKKIRIISAWRYPGVSPIGKKIPIPDDILEELKSEKLI